MAGTSKLIMIIVTANFLDSRSLDAEMRQGLVDFLSSLPVALERSDLRVVHAAWHPSSIDELRSSTLSAIDVFKKYHNWAGRLGEVTGLKQYTASIV